MFEPTITRLSGWIRWPRGRWWFECWLPLLLLGFQVLGQCPWPRTPLHVSLHSDCVCGYSNVRRLSVQCSPLVNFTQLLEVLNSPSVQRLPIDMLYINNATGLSGGLPRNAFRKLDIQQIHLTNTQLDRIDREAFAGLEDRLHSLTLQNTGLKEVPGPVKTLRALRTLDLSQNRIRRIRSGTFDDMHLTTLRLSFNTDLQLEREAFRGLSRTLKNLNLKGLNMKQIPDAIVNLTELAFLDLAQNQIEDVKPRMFRRHHLLTALSLERNLIRAMHPDTFVGLNDSLSSLSLLNNMLVEFPLLALSKLTGLRVLDLGFNAIRQLPDQAFRSNELLTLLALDGNPLRTLSYQTFRHLNHTLRGLSVGGKYFECDCKVRWLAEWAREYNLQITSRERNPQFCAKPPHLRNKPFTHIDFDDFVCPPLTSGAGDSLTPLVPFPSPVFTPKIKTSDITTPSTTTTTTTSSTTTTMATTTKTTTPTAKISSTSAGISASASLAPSSLPTTTTLGPIVIKSATSYVVPVVNDDTDNKITTNVPKKSLVTTTTATADKSPATLRITEATYRNGSVHIRWEPLPMMKSSATDYQVLYRYAGSKRFQHSELLPGRVYSYAIRTVNAGESPPAIVCVINRDAEEVDDYDESQIPAGQCREVRIESSQSPPPPAIIKKPTIVSSTRSSSTTTTTSLSSLYPSLKRLNDIDKIVIGISASVCLFIIVAVLIFSCCFYRSSSSSSVAKDRTLRAFAATNPACLSTKSLSPLAKSSNFEHEWETVSVYSTRSIPRARIHGGSGGGGNPFLTTNTDTLRSHLSSQPLPPPPAPAYIHPVSRYIGATLPAATGTGGGFQWLDGQHYLHHYPSVSHLPTTTTTAIGYPSYYHHPSGNLPPTVERSKSHRHHERTRTRNGKSGSRTPRRQQVPGDRAGPLGPPQFQSKSHIDLRSSAAGSNGGSSSNRLLLSSTSTTSNSYQSTQNDYDSDQWNGGNNTASTLPVTATATATNTYLYNGQSHHQQQQPHPVPVASRSTPAGTSRTIVNNDNEVDIYIDQHYAKRFNFS